MNQNDYLPDSQATFGIVSEIFRNNFVKLSSIYLTGIVPFQVFLVYFFLELGYSGDAEKKVFVLSMIAFFLYCWLKVFQSIFSTYFYCLLQEEPVKVSFGIKEIFYQICVQASSLVVYMLGFVIFFTLQASYNFYNYSLIVTPEKQKMDFSERLKSDWTNGKSLFDNAKLSIYFSGIILFVFINVISLIAIMPFILKTLFGIDTIFLKTMNGFFNLITFIIILNLTFLACDPFFKCAYSLRYFYKISLPKGGDLQFRLKRILKISILFLLIFNIFSISSVRANDNTEENLKEVLNQKKYQWRDGKKLQIEKLENSYLEELINNFLDWLFNRKINKDVPNQSSKATTINSDFLTPMLKILLIVFIATLCAFLLRNYKLNKKIKDDEIKTELQKPVIKKPEEDFFDKYKEDEWAKAARELMQQGDYRGAIRALYYQVILCLGEKNLLIIQRYKTNSQYKQELKNRAHSLPEVNNHFINIVLIFEEAWFSDKSMSIEDFNSTNSLVLDLKGILNG